MLKQNNNITYNWMIYTKFNLNFTSIKFVWIRLLEVNNYV